MSMIKVKTSELIGPALDWAVAKAEKSHIVILPPGNPEERWPIQHAGYPEGPYWPSQDWSQGGPLLEKHDVYFDRYPCDEVGSVVARLGPIPSPNSYFQNPSSPTRLIAACRAIVFAKFGAYVHIPEELIKGAQDGQ